MSACHTLSEQEDSEEVSEARLDEMANEKK
jgi:hypothetical protein